MTAPRDPQPERRLARERAAEWVCMLQDDEPGHHQQFSVWVKQSPLHLEEFLFAATAWKALDAVGPRDAAQVQNAIDAAVSAIRSTPGATADNVVDIQRTQDGPRANPPAAATRGLHTGRWAAGIAAVAVLAGLAWFGASAGLLPHTYVTAAGEQRTVRLEDGSVLHLNIDSRARVRLSGSNREIRLLKGEALFAVAPDSTRPFTVAAGEARIQVVGTQFNVRRRAANTTVSVLEGSVRVKHRRHPENSRALKPGEQAIVDNGAAGAITLTHPHAINDAIAWRERRLVFRGETLGEIASEINRYSPPLRIRVEGAAAAKQLAGSFSADDPLTLVRFLKGYEELAVEVRKDEVVVRTVALPQ